MNTIIIDVLLTKETEAFIYICIGFLTTGRSTAGSDFCCNISQPDPLPIIRDFKRYIFFCKWNKRFLLFCFPCSCYAALNQPKNCRHKNVADPYRWSATTVGYILDRQEYLGHTVLGKSICENFKTKQRRAATPDELMIFPDTHEAIIDQDT